MSGKMLVADDARMARVFRACIMKPFDGEHFGSETDLPDPGSSKQ